MRHASGHNYRNSSFINCGRGRYHVPQNVFLVNININIIIIYVQKVQDMNEVQKFERRN